MKKRKFSMSLLSLFLFFLSINIFSLKIYSQSLNWIKECREGEYAEGIRVEINKKQNVYFIGEIRDSSDVWGIYLIKYHEDNEIWNHKIDYKPYSSYSLLYDILIDDYDNIYFLYEHTLIKYNSVGDSLWEIKIQPDPINNPYLTSAYKIYIYNNIIYCIGAYWKSELNRGIWLVKIDTSGKKISEKIFDHGDWSEINEGDITVDSEGNIYVVGYIGWTVANIFLAKFDNNFNLIWEKEIGGEDHDEGHNIKIDSNNNIVVSGFVDKPWVGYCSKAWFGKFNPNGDTVFVKSTSYPCDNIMGSAFYSDLEIDNDNNIYLSGYGNGQYFINKYNEIGDSIWEFKTMDNSIISNPYGIWLNNDICIDSLNNIYFSGEYGYIRNIMFYGKISENMTAIRNNIRLIKPHFFLYQNYPNPFNPKTVINYSIPKYSHITLKVYDILGHDIITLVNEEKEKGNFEVEFNADNLSSGIYFYQMKTENYTQTKKMLLLR